MTPLFGFFPVCFFFASLVVLGVVMYLAGAGAGTTNSPDAPPADGPRPPYWVFAIVLVSVVVVLLLLSLVTAG